MFKRHYSDIKLFLFKFVVSFFVLLQGNIYSQQFINGNLATGSITKSNVDAPPGYLWSEVQSEPGSAISNTVNGIGAQITSNGGNAVSDDFTIPINQVWNISKLTFFAYQTGYYGTASPFTELHVRIYNMIPSNLSSEIIFGDLTTNRLTASSEFLMYRIPNTITPNGGTPPSLNRKIFKLEASIDLVLTAGTYWIEWQQYAGINSNFSPPSTVVNTRTQQDYNSIQWLGTSNNWIPLIDTGNPYTIGEVTIDMPFIVDYSTNSLEVNAKLNNNLSIAPNPVESFLEFKSKSCVNSLDIYDYHGKFVKNFITNQMNCNIIDLSSISSGPYILIFNGEKAVAVRNIIKL